MKSWRHGALAGPNPWQADTLEWATLSPPPNYNFAHIPVVTGRGGLWEHPAEQPVVAGLRTDTREVLITTLLDAEPEGLHKQPRDSIWPFLLAVCMGITFISSIFAPWGVLVGIGLGFLPALAWAWPSHPPEPERISSERAS
jgi:hypothetical protein